LNPPYAYCTSSQAKELFERGQQITDSEQKRETLKVMLALWPVQMKDLACLCFDARVFRRVVRFGSQQDTAVWSSVCKEWEHYVETSLPKSAVVYDSPVFRETHFRAATLGITAGAAAAGGGDDEGEGGGDGSDSTGGAGGAGGAGGKEPAKGADQSQEKWQKRADYEAWLSSRKGGEEGSEVAPQ
jgi:hypothetical protein